ncbi:MAG: FAD-dependent monooxygenase [Acidimicrobiia bacterium]
MTGSRAVIMGGSIGGLNAALWLRDAGWDVEVLERSRSPLEGRGAGIVMHPATGRYFTEHGLARLDEISAPVRCLRYLDPDAGVAHESPCRFRFTSWTTLYRGLVEALGPDRYAMGSEVVGFEDTGSSVAVRLAGGEMRPADLLVAADGVASTARSILAPDAAPRYAGYVAWRGAVGEWELSEATFGVLDESITYHLMERSHILAYPIPNVDGTLTSGRRQMNWVWYRNVAGGADLDDLMTDAAGQRHPLSLPPGRVREPHVGALRDAAAGLPAPLAEMVLTTAEPFIQVVVDVEVDRMVFGRVCLIGDAAFALRPHAAVGTAKAAEDAWQLARALGPVAGGNNHLDEALKRWETGQLALGRSVLERTRRAGDRSQFEGSWRGGEPLPFGLYEQGDSAIEP